MCPAPLRPVDSAGPWPGRKGLFLGQGRQFCGRPAPLGHVVRRQPDQHLEDGLDLWQHLAIYHLRQDLPAIEGEFFQCLGQAGAKLLRSPRQSCWASNSSTRASCSGVTLAGGCELARARRNACWSIGLNCCPKAVCSLSRISWRRGRGASTENSPAGGHREANCSAAVLRVRNAVLLMAASNSGPACSSGHLASAATVFRCTSAHGHRAVWRRRPFRRDRDRQPGPRPLAAGTRHDSSLTASSTSFFAPAWASAVTASARMPSTRCFVNCLSVAWACESATIPRPAMAAIRTWRS